MTHHRAAYTSKILTDEYDSEEARMLAIKNQKLQQALNNPFDMAEFWRQQRAGTPAVQRTENDFQPWEHNNNWDPDMQTDGLKYADAFERYYASLRGNVPFYWLIQQHPDDISALVGADPDMAPEIFRRLDREHDYIGEARRRDAAQEAEVERRIEEIMHVNQAVSLFSHGSVDMPRPSYEEARAQAIAEIKARDWQPDSKGIWRAIGSGLMKGVHLFEQGAVGAYNSFASVLNLSTMPMGVDVVDELGTGRQRAEETRDADIAAVKAEDSQQIGERYGAEMLFEMVESGEYADRNPGDWAIWMEMANGDAVMAAGMIVGDFMDRMEPAEQLELGTQVQRNTINMMEEADYEVTPHILDALAAYSKHVPGRIATSALMWFDDEDFKDDLLNLRFAEANQKLHDVDMTPSKALNIKGLGAVFLDFTTLTVFDPATWMFAPAGKAAYARPQTAAAARNIAEEGAARGLARSFINNIGNRNLAGGMADMKWIFDGAPEEFAELYGRTQVAYRAAEGAAGAGLGGKISKALNKLADMDWKALAKKKASPNVPVIKQHLESIPWQSSRMRGIRGVDHQITINDEVFTIKQFVDDGTRNAAGVPDELAVAMFDESGKLAAGGYVWRDGTAGWWSGLERGSKVFDELVDAITVSQRLHGHSDAARFVLGAAQDASITPAGAKTIIRQAKRILEQAKGKGAYIRSAFGEEELKGIMVRALLKGAVPTGYRSGAVAYSVGKRVREALEEGDMRSGWRHYFSKYKTTNVFRTRSRTAVSDVVDHIHLIWGDDVGKANEYLGKVMNQLEEVAERTTANVADARWGQLNAVARELDEINSLLRGADMMDEVGEAGLLRRQQELSNTYRNTYRELLEEYGDMNYKLDEVIQEMYEDFNRNVLAKMDEWKPFVNEQGMVPWEHMKVGGTRRQSLPSPSFKGLKVIDEGEVVPADLEILDSTMRTVFHRGDLPWTIVPMSPLDLITASTSMGAKNIQRLLANQKLRAVMDAGHQANVWWKLEKILRPSTAGVVSVDELSRIFHLYGVEAAKEFLYDKAVSAAARITRKLGAGDYSHLPERWQERIRRMADIPEHIRAGEALSWDQAGTEIIQIAPTDAGYATAASDFYHHFTSQKGYQAYLKGYDEFESFWVSPANRMHTGWGPEGPKIVSAQEAYDGWAAIESALVRNMDDKTRNFVLGEMRAAAEDAAAGGTGRMSREVFEYTPAVNGYKTGGFKQDPGVVSDLMTRGTEMFFSNPMNSRRNLLFRLAREKEVERLSKLYMDQGIEILDDVATKKALNIPSRMELSQFDPQILDYMSQRAGIHTERSIERAASAFAEDELTNILYAWDMGSRVGQTTGQIFPFGGPWADMWGFWGRELLSKPIYRGAASENRFINSFKPVADMIGRGTGVNPRTAAFISRMANVDLAAEDVLWTDVDINFNPMVFFPTQGENAFGTLIPGFGFVPTIILDLVIEMIHDPIEDPVGYQNLIDEISEFIPSVDYTQEPIFQSLLSGGNIASAMRTFGGLSAALAPGTWGQTSILNDVSSNIDLNREVGVQLVDDMEDLLAQEDPEILDDMLNGLIHDAKRSAGLRTAVKHGSRAIVPARTQFDSGYETLQEEWVAVAAEFPVLQGKTRVNVDDLDDDAVLAQYANDVRERYFELDPAEADLIIVKHPQIAVNLVSSWEWTDRGKAELQTEAVAPYRSGGGQIEKARHETYINKGYIKPMDPTNRAFAILGSVQAAKRRVARRAYEQTVSNINDFMWEEVLDDEIKGLMQNYVDEFGELFNVSDPKTLWLKWGSYENDFEFELSQVLGYEYGSEEQKKAFQKINVPTNMRAWGTRLPTDVEALSTKAKNMKLGAFMAAFPDLDWPTDIYNEIGFTPSANTNFAQLSSAVYDYVGQDRAANSVVRGAYENYIGERGADSQAALNTLRESFKGDEFDRSARHQLDKFIMFEQNVNEERDTRGYTLQSDLFKVREEFGKLSVLADDDKFMGKVWKEVYERSYGPLQWTPPAPPVLFEDGNLNSNAYRPVIRQLRDGDSFVVKDGKRNKEVRLLGVRARDYSLDEAGAIEDENRLRNALIEAAEQGVPIYLVRDPDQFGSNTDKYGRELAWLFIGETPYYFEDSFLPTDYTGR